MTVADNTSRNQYTATSGQTVFAYTFEIVDKDDVVVLKNGTTLSEGTDYAVSNVGNDSGGNVTLTVGATAGDILTLYRDMPYSRTQSYTNSGDFLASEVNSDFDNLWLAGEQTQRSFSQSIRKPITDSDSISMELPVATSRADSFLTFDSTGAVTTTAVSSATAPQNIYRQQMTGDGTTTAFTLNFDSGSVGGAIVIYIDGVYQEGDTYSASGTSLVFTEAPPTNASIEVMYFKVAVAADIDATGTIYSQQFTGNGSTTAYTLGIPPGSTGKALQIFINGVYQDQGSYTVSGATLTFSEAPPTTSQIDVIAFRIKEIGATDANLVTYTPAGTGAVQTTVQERLRKIDNNADIVITVGASGDYSNLSDALKEASTYYGQYVSGGAKIEINLLSGFVLAEQIFVVEKDLSFIEITSVDSVVTITRSAITQTLSITNWVSNYTPVFTAMRNGKLPVINCLFNMDSTGTPTGKRVGIFLHENSSGIVTRTNGITNCDGRGVEVSGSLFYGRESNFSGSLDAAYRISNGSMANIRGSNGSGSVRGLYATSAMVVAIDSNFSGCSEYAIYATGASVVHAADTAAGTANYSNSGIHNLLTEDGSLINIQNADLSDATTNAIDARSGSIVIAIGADLSGFGGKDISISENATVNRGTTGSELTISSGVITVSSAYHKVDTQGNASTDDLDSINGGQTGQVVTLQAISNVRDVVIKHGTGNLYLNTLSDFTMNSSRDVISLIYNGSEWNEISRSNNG